MEGWAGAKSSITMTVQDSDTAMAVGSGNLPVLGTPRLIAMCEAATVAAIDNLMPEGKTSVGTRIAVNHLQASAVGSEIVVEARLESTDGRKLEFIVEARQAGALIMSGHVQRILVDTDRFMAGLDHV